MSKKKFPNNLYYSTDSGLEITTEDIKAIDYSKKVFIALNKSKNSKLITSVSNIDTTEEELNRIAKIIKTKCGTGGSVKFQ